MPGNLKTRMAGNLKTRMAGTYHSFKHAKYARRYLAEFCYRLNRRFNLPAMLSRLLRALVSTQPWPLKGLRAPEACSSSGQIRYNLHE